MNANIYEEAKNRLIFALDMPEEEKAKYWLNLLKDKVGVFKVGLELFLGVGPQIVRLIKDTTGAGVFLDLKFHDIPATVLAACRQAQKYGVDFVTVHAIYRHGLFQEFRSSPTKIIGVTVLTSLDTPDLRAMGITEELAQAPYKLVLKRAALAKEAGCAGVVCSGQEVKYIKEHFGQEFLVITPGIRLKSDSVQDQKRVTTPYEAIKNGSNYIVVGRSIRSTPNPSRAAEQIVKEIASALVDTV
ncbi:MAG: orotidine-5'-phosphate decarboxylase [Candidatus Desulfofervidaceae bacterium]|nr:orotidine-5'-phosphate decarboxylase [Candidatus Desulfofervidaceae bacterium]